MPPTRQSTAELPLAPAVFLILLTLADEDAHGYRIRAAVIERSNGAVTLDPGSLYRLVARLLDDGLIAEVPEQSGQTHEQRRRSYRLTSVGRRVLNAETERMAQLVSASRAIAARKPGRA